ncbi:MAG TPA: SRPBCC domain-containing protein [Thermoanaerobaculia bacterium]|nr:SRPBCC domain-containing protein [Thermoanaerobaculia bacterium]
MQKTTFSENPEQKTLTVERTFEAPVERVWAAWTEPELLEQWWAPAPWRAHTKSFDFSEGGHWHYFMESPDGERHWSWVDYRTIEPRQAFAAADAFCDEEGVRNTEMPGTEWDNRFEGSDGRTTVRVTLTFLSVDDMKNLIEMGFKEGFTMGLDQLEKLLANSD